MRRVDSLEKTDAGRDWGQEEKGTTEDEMAGWHHWLDGCESEWTLVVGDGQGGLACCDSWGRKESDTTERLIWSDLSHLYIPTGKTIVLTIYTFVGKVMSLLFNIRSRFVIAFLPRSKHLLISWLPSASAVILESMKIKSVTVSTFPLSSCHEVMGPDAMVFRFFNVEF